ALPRRSGRRRSPARRWRRAVPTEQGSRSFCPCSERAPRPRAESSSWGCGAAAWWDGSTGSPWARAAGAGGRRWCGRAGPRGGGGQGGAAGGSWRGWPGEVGFPLFHSEERPTKEGEVARRDDLLDLDRQGIELSASRDWRWSGEALSLDGRVLWDQVSPTSQR